MNNKICLSQETLLLPEVTVGGFSGFELLRQAVANTQKKLLLPGKIDAYYKEFVVANGEYTRFSDGAISYYVHNTKGELAVDGEIKESRAYALPTTNEVDIDLISPINYKVSMDYYDPVFSVQYTFGSDIPVYARHRLGS